MTKRGNDCAKQYWRVCTAQKNGTSNKNYVLPSNLQHVNETIFRVILKILDSENRETYLAEKRYSNCREKKEKSKKLFEETQLSLKRKKYNEVLDVLFELESKLRDEEMKLVEATVDGNFGITKQRVDLLKKNMENLLVAEESYIHKFLPDISS